MTSSQDTSETCPSQATPEESAGENGTNLQTHDGLASGDGTIGAPAKSSEEDQVTATAVTEATVQLVTNNPDGPSAGDATYAANASDENSTTNDESKDEKKRKAADDEPDATTEEPTTLSKNQMKKKRRLERMLEVKQRRKQQEKDSKMAKAKAEGRDLEAERRDQLARAESGEGKQRRQKLWENKLLPLAQKSFQVCLDCSFESSMSNKEVNSLALQLRYCYASNKKAKHPCLLAATSVGGVTLTNLQNVAGFEEWGKRAFVCTDQPLDEYYKSNISNVVYLTSDSENTLTDLDDSKIYVIGGIVDRNRLKFAAYNRAKQLGVATARLPLDEHLQEMHATRVLTCNHVFEILLQYRDNGRNWRKALMDVLPHRKDAKFANDGDDGGCEDEERVEEGKQEGITDT